MEWMFPRFNRFFESLQSKYVSLLDLLLKHRKFTLWSALGILVLTFMIPLVAGTDFFPSADTGLMKLHFRAPAGTRIEQTERMVAEVENGIRKIIPPAELLTINSFIGLPISYNLGFVPSDNVGEMDAEISIALNPDHHPTVQYMKKIREQVTLAFPDAFAYFQPADIVNQVLNFGLSAPIDIQFDYGNIDKSYSLAQNLISKMKAIPGAEDIALKQVFNYPTIRFNVDRMKAAQLGVSQRDIANSMLVSLSSSSLGCAVLLFEPAKQCQLHRGRESPLGGNEPGGRFAVDARHSHRAQFAQEQFKLDLQEYSDPSQPPDR